MLVWRLIFFSIAVFFPISPNGGSRAGEMPMLHVSRDLIIMKRYGASLRRFRGILFSVLIKWSAYPAASTFSARFRSPVQRQKSSVWVCILLPRVISRLHVIALTLVRWRLRAARNSETWNLATNHTDAYRYTWKFGFLTCPLIDP